MTLLACLAYTSPVKLPLKEKQQVTAFDFFWNEVKKILQILQIEKVTLLRKLRHTVDWNNYQEDFHK